ncbi:MAG: glycoside hydrolase family 31 protein [Ardenticatenaceae bacterium]|nr:glycoside hydrolase family 31 protein [Ardenticatenaceae bacterium]
MILSHFKLPLSGKANPAAVVFPQDGWRLTILTSRLIRLEYDPHGRFEDRPSQTFWYRQHEVPAFDIQQKGEQWQLSTGHLEVMIDLAQPGPPAGKENTQNLTIKVIERETTWTPGTAAAGNLGGTYRTLDGVSGRIPLEPGLMSKDGWAVIDDTSSLVFTEDGWLAPRDAHPDYLDWYFFGYGRDYQGCLREFSLVAGQTPMIPRWALGNWWSRYWPYTDRELQEVIEGFEHYDIPLSVCIIDMDWHLTDTNGFHSGWTGYTWNRDLFPDPAAFLDWLTAKGLRKALNLHPAEGVAPHEEMYAQMAAAVGVDPAAKATVPFAISNPDFAEAYFRILHHPQEEIGIDFWWIDWQQGTQSRVDGLDPLWMLNHLHFYDLGRDGVRRPFIFSRYGGLGHHRYPIGFSGDTVSDWPTLNFQPYFTATAANVGYGWWSHDIGGHMLGVQSSELYLRWVQYGVFSPIFRLHSTNNPFSERRPWAFDDDTLRVAGDALRLRHALIPYIYTMTWRNFSEQQPLIQPMYHHWPLHEAAYLCSQQYYFGSELITAPFTEPADADTNLSRQVVWLPPGDWFDFFTGEYIEGDRWLAVYGSREMIPTFAAAGAIIPLEATAGWGSGDNPVEIDLHLFAGRTNSFDLYEDDGQTTAYLQNSYALTTLSQEWHQSTMRVVIEPAAGDLSHLPENRRWQVIIHGIIQPDRLHLKIGEEPLSLEDPTSAVSFHYDSMSESLTIAGLTTGTDRFELTLETEQITLLSKRNRKLETLQEMIAAFKLDSQAKYILASEHHLIYENVDYLVNFQAVLTASQRQAILETVTEAGIHAVRGVHETTTLIGWNPHEVANLTLTHAVINQSQWRSGRFTGHKQLLGRDWHVIQPEQLSRRGQIVPVNWSLKLTYDGLHTTELGS